VTSSEVARDIECQTGVIGGTGFVGGAVLRALCCAGAKPVSLLPHPLIEHTAACVTAEPRRRGEAVIPIFRHFDFLDERTFEPAMSGIKRLFLMRPPAIGDVERVVFPLIEAAVKSGVERIVFLSVAGAETRAYLPHAKIEACLIRLACSAGLNVGILRPGFFAQNLLSAYREDIKHDDRLYVCAARGRVAFVDTEDVGAIAARALMDGCLDGKAAELTGPIALGFDDVAALLTKALNRPIVYTHASIAGFFCHRIFHRHASLMEAAIITALHAGLRRGHAEAITEEVKTLLGRPATPLTVVVARHLDAWLA
jgi:uncharacterized protein YbjT (DUF2867 family)